MSEPEPAILGVDRASPATAAAAPRPRPRPAARTVTAAGFGRRLGAAMIRAG